MLQGLEDELLWQVPWPAYRSIDLPQLSHMDMQGARGIGMVSKHARIISISLFVDLGGLLFGPACNQYLHVCVQHVESQTLCSLCWSLREGQRQKGG